MKKFTLLELLIVIAIIGILVSLLLPSLSNARAKAYQAVCLSNQRQIGVGAFTYSRSNANALPSLRGKPIASAAKSYWRAQIANSMGTTFYGPGSKELTKDIFRCPTSLTTIPELYTPLTRQAGGISYNGYGLRKLYKHLGGSTDPSNAAKASTVTEPSTTFMTTDSSDTYIQKGHLLAVTLPSRNEQKSPTRHFRGGNAGYVDGHAAYKKFAAFEAGQDGDQDYFLRRDKNKAWLSD